MSELTVERCVPCEGGIPPLSQEKIDAMLQEIDGWALNEAGEICRNFAFKDYYQTMSFVNAIAWMANQQGHHPDLEVSYNKCCVRYSTHAIDGLSKNDFICAAKVNQIFLGK